MVLKFNWTDIRNFYWTEIRNKLLHVQNVQTKHQLYSIFIAHYAEAIIRRLYNVHICRWQM